PYVYGEVAPAGSHLCQDGMLPANTWLCKAGLGDSGGGCCFHPQFDPGIILRAGQCCAPFHLLKASHRSNSTIPSCCFSAPLWPTGKLQALALSDGFSRCTRRPLERFWSCFTHLVYDTERLPAISRVMGDLAVSLTTCPSSSLMTRSATW